MNSPYQPDAGSTPLNQDTTSLGSAAIPLLSTGERPRYVFVQSTSLTAPTLVAFGQSGVVAAANVQFVVLPGDGVCVNVSGNTHVAWAALASNTLIVTPLANGGGVPVSSPSEV